MARTTTRTRTTLGRGIIVGCAKRGKTQKELAEAVGIGPGHLSEIIYGVYSPRWELVCAIAGELGVSLDELAGRPARVTADDMREIGVIVEEAKRIGREDERRRQRLGEGE